MFLFRSYAARQSWLLIIRCMWKAVQTVMSNQQDFRVFVAFSLLSGCFFVHRVYVACRTQIAHAVNVNRCWIGFVWPLFVHVTEAWFYRSQTARPPTEQPPVNHDGGSGQTAPARAGTAVFPAPQLMASAELPSSLDTFVMLTF